MIPYINIHTHKPEIDTTFILNANSKDNLPDFEYISFGLHPWDIEKLNIDFNMSQLRKFCSDKKLSAIGEIGLDRAIKTNLEIQKEVFITQLEIAKQYQLPVIIHCVKAWNDILTIRKNHKYTNYWIFHGFTGNLQTALQIIKSGCYLSFGKALIYNKKIQSIMIQLPKENLFFETDNSELNIEDVYQKVAELSDICIEDLKLKILDNFNKVFGNKIN